MSNIFYKKRIILLFLLVILAIFAFFLFSLNREKGGYVKVSRDGVEVERVSLNEDATYEYNDHGEMNTLVIKDGKADVVSANCKNQVCVNTAPVSETGEVIACLPHKLIFEVIE